MKAPEKVTEPLRWGQMFLGMHPSQCISYYPVHSEFTLVFKHSMLVLFPTGVEMFTFCFCSAAPGEELKTTQRVLHWLLKLALWGVTVHHRMDTVECDISAVSKSVCLEVCGGARRRLCHFLYEQTDIMFPQA